MPLESGTPDLVTPELLCHALSCPESKRSVKCNSLFPSCFQTRTGHPTASGSSSAWTVQGSTAVFPRSARWSRCAWMTGMMPKWRYVRLGAPGSLGSSLWSPFWRCHDKCDFRERVWIIPDCGKEVRDAGWNRTPVLWGICEGFPHSYKNVSEITCGNYRF